MMEKFPFGAVVMAALVSAFVALWIQEAETADRCDLANRLVLDGKPYICHPMPEGTGHHD